MVKIDVVSLSLKKDKEILVELPEAKITSPKDVYVILKGLIGDSDRENFALITLDTKNYVTAVHTVSIGTLNSALIHPREVFKVAIIKNAASIIIGHNHPSGNSSESNEDIQVTKRLKESGELLGIQLLDHIIVGDSEYTSLKEKGLF